MKADIVEAELRKRRLDERILRLKRTQNQITWMPAVRQLRSDLEIARRVVPKATRNRMARMKERLV